MPSLPVLLSTGTKIDCNSLNGPCTSLPAEPETRDALRMLYPFCFMHSHIFPQGGWTREVVAAPLYRWGTEGGMTGSIILEEGKFLSSFGYLLIPGAVSVTSTGVPSIEEFWRNFQERRWRGDDPPLSVFPVPLRVLGHITAPPFFSGAPPAALNISILLAPVLHPCFPKTFQELPYAGPLPPLS